MNDVRPVRARLLLSLLAGLCWLATPGIAEAAHPAAAAFPKSDFPTCYDNPVEACAHFLAANWKEKRRIADKPCHPDNWPSNSTEQYICHYLFGRGASETGPAPVVVAPQPPKENKCLKEKSELEELLKKSQAADAECEKSLEACNSKATDNAKSSKDSDADKLRSDLEELKKRLASCEADKTQLKSDLDAKDSELKKSRTDLADCQTQLPDSKEGGSHSFGTSIRMGFVWTQSQRISSPSLDLSIAQRLIGGPHWDINVDLDAVNGYFGNGGTGVIGAGGEIDWFPQRSENFGWGIGAQLDYAFVIVESNKQRAYGNGADLQGQLLMRWSVTKDWALGLRVHVGGFGTAAVGWGGIFGLDFVVIRHAHAQ